MKENTKTIPLLQPGESFKYARRWMVALGLTALVALGVRDVGNQAVSDVRDNNLIGQLEHPALQVDKLYSEGKLKGVVAVEVKQDSETYGEAGVLAGGSNADAGKTTQLSDIIQAQQGTTVTPTDELVLPKSEVDPNALNAVDVISR